MTNIHKQWSWKTKFNIIIIPKTEKQTNGNSNLKSSKSNKYLPLIAVEKKNKIWIKLRRFGNLSFVYEHEDRK